MDVTFDAEDVKRVFRMYPSAAIRATNNLIAASAIDTQRAMRQEVNVGATGDGRRAIKYKLDPANLSAEVIPDFPYAEALENGSRPHYVSVKPGSSLYRWANHKGINPYAVRASIAKKGTRAHPFVKPVYERAKITVPRDIIRGFGLFIEGVNNGRI